MLSRTHRACIALLLESNNADDLIKAIQAQAELSGSEQGNAFLKKQLRSAYLPELTKEELAIEEITRFLSNMGAGVYVSRQSVIQYAKQIGIGAPSTTQALLTLKLEGRINFREAQTNRGNKTHYYAAPKTADEQTETLN